jgi:hypothetical protein
MDLLKALCLGIGQVLTGATVGTLVEVLADKLYPVPNNGTPPDFTQSLVRLLIQLPIGIVALSSVMLVITRGHMMVSPIGDTSLLFFFFISQPNLIYAVASTIGTAWEDAKKLIG